MGSTTNHTTIKSLYISTLKEKTAFRAQGTGFILLLEGQMTVYEKNQTIHAEANSLILFDSTFFASFTPSSDADIAARMIIVTYDASFIYNFLPTWNLFPKYIAYTSNASYVVLLHQIMNLASTYYGQSPHRELHLMRSSFDIIHSLAESYDTFDAHGKLSREERVGEIIQYLQNNYDRPITLVELAEHLHISSAYLSRYIKKHLNMGFQEYLRQIRTEHATEELLTTNTPITLVALNNGFPNVAALNKQFKELYGMTPTQFRNRPQELPTEECVGLAEEERPLQALRAVHLPEIAAPLPGTDDNRFFSPETEIIELSPFTKKIIDCTWNDMISIGFCSHFSDIRFQNQLIELLGKMHFKYGHIQGIFKDMNSLYRQSPQLYPLTSLDVIFDFFKHQHLLPHIDFTYMSHADKHVNGDLNTELIRRFLKYYIKRYGQNRISEWRFEYSMPRSADGQFPLLSLEQFASNCKELSEIIKTLLPQAEFGVIGCSPRFTWATNQNILKALREAAITPDYISLHLSPYEPAPKKPQEHLMLSANPHFFRDYIRKLKNILVQYNYDSIPLRVTSLKNEWKTSAYANDSAYMAPWLFTTYFDLCSQVKSMAYTAFSDSVWDNPGDNQYFFGGHGIITMHQIRKPSWYALFMLAKAAPKILYQSEHCLVNSFEGISQTKHTDTAVNPLSCQILLHNFTPYTESYRINPNEKYALEQTYRSFQKGHNRVFIIDCSNWPQGTYRLQKFTMGRNHGSALDEYIRLGIRDDMLPIELDYLKDKSVMDIEVSYPVMDRNNQLTVILEPMDIVVLVLYPAG